MSLPLGIRSNNPGNLRPGKQKWLGELNADPRGYCVFVSAEMGIRAMMKNLLTYQRKYGLRTVETIISRWAPGSENDTESYIRQVEAQTGIRRALPISLQNPDTLMALTKAIIRHENGKPPAGTEAWYTDETLHNAMAAALNG